MVRYGNLDDLEDIMEMLELCKLEMKNRNLTFWNDLYPTKQIIKDDLLGGVSIVFELNNKVVAFLSMYPKKPSRFEECYHDHSNYCYVQRVMVHPAFRRHGYAQQILNFVETLGYSSIRLLTRNTNIYSVNLYKKLGYKVVREEIKDNVIMQNCEKMIS